MRRGRSGNVRTLTFEELDLGGEDVEDVEVPAKWAICSRCDGEGSHTRPGIDDHGISMEEWHNDWSEEERETYLSGGYDVTCSCCNGSGKVLVPDLDVVDEKVKEAIEQRERAEAESRREDAYWRRLESGGGL